MSKDTIILRDKPLHDFYESERKRLRLKFTSDLYRKGLLYGLRYIRKMKEKD